MSKARRRETEGGLLPPGYAALRAELERLLETARRTSARAVNAVMTATYWEIGRRIVQHEQGGRRRAGYGEQLLAHLAADLTQRFGRGFSRQNLQRFRHFYLANPLAGICPTVSGKSPAGAVAAIGPTASGVLALPDEKLLAAEIDKARRMLEARGTGRPGRRGGV